MKSICVQCAAVAKSARPRFACAAGIPPMRKSQAESAMALRLTTQPSRSLPGMRIPLLPSGPQTKLQTRPQGLPPIGQPNRPPTGLLKTRLPRQWPNRRLGR